MPNQFNTERSIAVGQAVELDHSDAVSALRAIRSNSNRLDEYMSLNFVALEAELGHGDLFRKTARIEDDRRRDWTHIDALVEELGLVDRRGVKASSQTIRRTWERVRKSHQLGQVQPFRGSAVGNQAPLLRCGEANARSVHMTSSSDKSSRADEKRARVDEMMRDAAKKEKDASFAGLMQAKRT